jgi:hypothetical protein
MVIGVKTIADNKDTRALIPCYFSDWEDNNSGDR